MKRTVFIVAVCACVTQTWAQCEQVWLTPRPDQALAGADKEVLASLVVQEPGGPVLYVGGKFSAIASAAASGVARWDGSEWSSVGTGVGVPGAYAVHALAEFDGGLVAAGAFAEAGGAPAVGVAHWDGAAWHALGAGLSVGAVRALAVYQGELVAGGSFIRSGGVPMAGLARWDGATWQALGSGVSGEIRALLSAHGLLYIGGSFTAIGGQTASNAAQ